MPEALLLEEKPSSSCRIDSFYARDRLDLVECKLDPDALEEAGARAFRALYPAGSNFLLSPAVKTPYRIRRRGQVFTVAPVATLG